MTMTERAANKRRTIIAKFLNFKDKQVLSKCKARKLQTKGEDFLKMLWRNTEGLLQRAKELQEERKFAKVVYDKLIVRNRRSRLENAEEGDSCA